jgi:Anticodon binding domain
MNVQTTDERPTLERFRELRAGAGDVLDKQAAKEVLRELKAVGGDLRAVRRALAGRDSGPELWAVIAALPRDETLRRIDAAL